MVKTVLLIVAVVVAVLVLKRLLAGPSIGAAEAGERVASGAAVLVDVREPGEWASGVAAPALLLPLSDLRGSRTLWGPALEANRGKELILYCASGTRSGLAAAQLRREGFPVRNAGSFGGWRAAGLPVRQP